MKQFHELNNVDIEKFVTHRNTEMGKLIWNTAMEKAASRIEAQGYVIAADQIRELKK